MSANATAADGERLQADIVAWANAAFGPATPLAVAARALMEAAELIIAVQSGDTDEIAHEAADVAIVLCRLAARLRIQMFEPPHRQEHRPPALDGAIALAGHIAGICACLEPEHRRNAEGVSVLLDISRTRLHMLARRVGFDLIEAVEGKLAVNRARVWCKAPGRSVHQKAEAAP